LRLELLRLGRCCSGIFWLQPRLERGAASEAGVVLPLLDSAGRKISQLEVAVDNRLEEEGHALA
jgi:hypothetical protein